MSIIQDALKKAESSSQPADLRPKAEQVNEVRGLRPAVKQTAQNAKKQPAPNRLLPIAAALLTILAVSVFCIMQYLSKDGAKPDKPNKTSVGSAQQVSYKPLVKDPANGSNAASSAGTLKAVKPPDLVLNGIMYLEEGPRALINNFIVEPGELVSGAKVKEINRQNVILEYENVEITLSLK